MRRRTAFLVLLVTPLLGSLVYADEAQPGGGIPWRKDLRTALGEAKQAGQMIMVCVNARYVEGKVPPQEESAAKGLREVLYKDPRVVKRARDFLCVLLTPEGSSAEYGELRTVGIEGRLVSPQHIFLSADGSRIWHRVEYWPHGAGEAGVKALVDMMTTALAKPLDRDAKPAPPSLESGPAEQAKRAAWIAGKVEDVATGNFEKRDAALASLIAGDRDGDSIRPLTALLPEKRREPLLLIAILRALGRDGLDLAASPIADHLTHKDDDVRANAAVSLEYIGCSEKRVLTALKKAAGKEKDEAVANHMYRALGRCGAKDAGVRALLLKKAGSAKSEFASYGPCIGLAYYEGDAKAMRGVEKLLKKIGVPGSRRGGGQNAVKRSVLSWTLASIGDAKSGTFVRERLMDGLEHVQAVWVAGLLAFWEAVARVCEGERELLGAVEDGVRGAVAYVKGIDLARYGAETRNLMDDARKGRKAAGFTPKGDHLLDDDVRR